MECFQLALERKMGVFFHLPRDVQESVLQHWAAGVLQVHFMRWHRLKHVRHPLWRRLRARLPRAVHATLVHHAAVRREWSREPASWLMQSDDDLMKILSEINEGFWGVRESCVQCRITNLAVE